MELRRALLLFAVVLGLAAIASSIARPPERRGGDETTTTDAAAPAPSTAQEAKPVPGSGPAPGSPGTEAVTLTFEADAKQPQTLKLAVGRPATVLAEVGAAAEVGIPTLGLTEPAEPLTPAVFDVFATSPGKHRVLLDPVAAGEPNRTIGTLRVVPAS